MEILSGMLKTSEKSLARARVRTKHEEVAALLLLVEHCRGHWVTGPSCAFDHHRQWSRDLNVGLNNSAPIRVGLTPGPGRKGGVLAAPFGLEEVSTCSKRGR
jgi:hypothetical protein